MTNGNFDEIRDILRQSAEQQLRTQQNIDRLADQLNQAQTTTQQNIDRLAERMDDLAGWSDAELQRLAEETVSMISSLAHDLDALSSNVNAYITQSIAFLAAEQRDRAEFRQQMIGLQTETRNILRELADLRRQQQGNGH